MQSSHHAIAREILGRNACGTVRMFRRAACKMGTAVEYHVPCTDGWLRCLTETHQAGAALGVSDKPEVLIDGLVDQTIAALMLWLSAKRVGRPRDDELSFRVDESD